MKKICLFFTLILLLLVQGCESDSNKVISPSDEKTEQTDNGKNESTNDGTENNEESTGSLISVSKSRVSFDFEGGECKLTINAKYSWTATCSTDWINLQTPDGIAGEEPLKFIVQRNTTLSERKATITLKNENYNLIQEVYVIQSQFDPIIETIERVSLEYLACERFIKVTSTVGYNVTDDADWLTSDVAEGGINLSATSNGAFETRSATITITTKENPEAPATRISVVQAPAETQYAIYYTSSDKNVINPHNQDGFGANIIGNHYKDNQGVLIFDNPITLIGEMAFSSCASLASIIIPNSVISIGNKAFYWCTSLTGVTIPNSVTSIGESAFYKCTSLTSVTIPDSVTSIGDRAFYDCSSLTNITIGEGVISIGKYTFTDCYSLTSIVISDNNTVYDSRNNCNAIIETTINKLRYGCKSSIIPDSITTIDEYAFCGCHSLTSITIPNSVTEIGQKAFYDCSLLTNITIPNSVTKIGQGAFGHYTRLEEVYISDLLAWCKIDFDGASANPLNSGAKLYINNTKITELTLPSNISEIKKHTFHGCTSLTNVIIPNDVTLIEVSAFCQCSSLTSVTIPDSVTSIGNSAFAFCSRLKSITIPDSVTLIGERTFGGCTSLTTITIPDSVTEIGQEAFMGCTGELIINSKIIELNYTYYDNSWLYGAKFTKLTIGDDIVKIGIRAFNDCSSLINVNIPDSVTEIGQKAFYGCTAMICATIGKCVTTIGTKAFGECSSLQNVYCKPVNPPRLGEYAFINNASERKFYVPRTSVDLYKSSSYWSNYHYSSYIVGYDF